MQVPHISKRKPHCQSNSIQFTSLFRHIGLIQKYTQNTKMHKNTKLNKSAVLFVKCNVFCNAFVENPTVIITQQFERWLQFDACLQLWDTNAHMP